MVKKNGSRTKILVTTQVPQKQTVPSKFVLENRVCLNFVFCKFQLQTK